MHRDFRVGWHTWHSWVPWLSHRQRPTPFCCRSKQAETCVETLIQRRKQPLAQDFSYFWYRNKAMTCVFPYIQCQNKGLTCVSSHFQQSMDSLTHVSSSFPQPLNPMMHVSSNDRPSATPETHVKTMPMIKSYQKRASTSQNSINTAYFWASDRSFVGKSNGFCVIFTIFARKLRNRNPQPDNSTNLNL